MSPDRPHVLFVTKSDLSGRAGHSIITRNVATAFVENKSVDTTVVSPEPASPEDVPEAVRDGVHLAPRSDSPSMPSRVHGVANAFRTLRRTIRAQEPDLLVARMAPDMLAPAVLASRHDVPYALLSRGTSYKRLRLAPLLTRIYRYNVRVADRVYAATDEIKRDADRMRGSDQPETVVLSNAVDPDAFRPRPRAEARASVDADLDDAFVVGFVGTMKPYHRVDALVRSLEHAAFDDLHLLLVGDGPELERLRSLATDLGVAGRVHFPGFVPHEDVDRYLSACDALYAVRSLESATPVKVFEYLACERPVIVREMAELAFVTEHDLGRTVPEPEPPRIAEAVAELRALSAAERRSMGERGREYVEREWTWDAFAQRVLDDFFG